MAAPLIAYFALLKLILFCLLFLICLFGCFAFISFVVIGARLNKSAAENRLTERQKKFALSKAKPRGYYIEKSAVHALTSVPLAVISLMWLGVYTAKSTFQEAPSLIILLFQNPVGNEVLLRLVSSDAFVRVAIAITLLTAAVCNVVMAIWNLTCFKGACIREDTDMRNLEQNQGRK